MDIKEVLFNLSEKDAVGDITSAADFAAQILTDITGEVTRDNLSVMGVLKGEKDYTLLLDAHIDQVAFVITNVDDEGFLTVSNAGGIDIRCLPSRAVTVHGKEKITAVFCSTPPHLASGEKEYTDIAEIKLDTALGKRAKEIVSVGDYATFNALPISLSKNMVSGRSFDDRSGVACLLEVARRLKNKKLPFNVAFLFSDAEELGLRGATTAAFKLEPNEAIAVDVSFGNGIGISAEECGELGEGAMIGISPVLDGALSKKLINLAKENNIKYQTEVMGGKTGTNADVISVSRGGVKTATVSIPLRNMHTEVEVLNLDDLGSVCDLLEKYILSGGLLGA